MLTAIGQTSLTDSFYLSGGTALAEFYLQHRYSVDLDFFTADPTAIGRVAPVLQTLAPSIQANITFTRTLGSFLECFVQNANGDRVKMDFALQSPYQLDAVHLDTTYQIQIDSLLDIACNKLSALFDRSEPKDFVDVYFLCKEIMPFDELVRQTRQKHVGIDDYWLAVALQRVQKISLLPQMIKPVTIEEMREFFLKQVEQLMKNI